MRRLKKRHLQFCHFKNLKILKTRAHPTTANFQGISSCAILLEREV